MQPTVSTFSNFNIIVIISTVIVVVVLLIAILITGIICCKLYHKQTLTTTEQDISVTKNTAYNVRGMLVTDNEAYHIEQTTTATSTQPIDELYDEIAQPIDELHDEIAQPIDEFYDEITCFDDYYI